MFPVWLSANPAVFLIRPMRGCVTLKTLPSLGKKASDLRQRRFGTLASGDLGMSHHVE
jgi:hypothetical protein